MIGIWRDRILLFARSGGRYLLLNSLLLGSRLSVQALVRVGHWAIVPYAVVLAAFCYILNAVGISLTWVLTVLGVIVGGAALPVGMIVLWEPISIVAAIGAPWIGFPGLLWELQRRTIRPKYWQGI